MTARPCDCSRVRPLRHLWIGSGVVGRHERNYKVESGGAKEGEPVDIAEVDFSGLCDC